MMTIYISFLTVATRRVANLNSSHNLNLLTHSQASWSQEQQFFATYSNFPALYLVDGSIP